MTLFAKPYRDAACTTAAHAHYRWLAAVAPAEIELPALVHVRAQQLVFQLLNGDTPSARHLPDLAAALGRLHHAAPRSRTSTTHTTAGLTITDFVTSRREALHAAGQGHGASAPRATAVSPAAESLRHGHARTGRLASSR